VSSGDRLAAIASGFVGALALATSGYNVYLQRAQVRAQVWPHVEWSVSNVEGFAYNLESNGVGPAIVRGARVTVDGAPVKNWHEATDLLASTVPAFRALKERGDEGELEYVHSSFAWRVLSPGAVVHPIDFSHLAAPDKNVVEKAFERVDVELCYCSTLGDCWMARWFTSRPVAACPTETLTFVD
jgi:hypothetical protein